MKLLLMILAAASYLFANVSTTVSIAPQQYFVQKIGGDKVSVEVMVQPGSSPATYEPSPKQMQRLSNSDIYFSIGVPFEKRWLHRFKDVAKQTTFINSAKGIKKEPIAKHSHKNDHHAHEHGHDHHAHHDHETKKQMLDPHVWLSPALVKTVAKNIFDALAAQDEKNRTFYKQNYETFIKELVELDKMIAQNLSQIKSNKFIVFHPSWGYFAKDYGLEQVAIEVEGKNPKQKDLIKLIEFAKKEGIKAVFVAPEFSQKSAKVIAQNIGGKTITVSPVAKEWAKNLLQMSKELQEVLD